MKFSHITDVMRDRIVTKAECDMESILYMERMFCFGKKSLGGTDAPYFLVLPYPRPKKCSHYSTFLLPPFRAV